MTVSADKFALGDLREDQRSVVTADERADVVEFLEPRQVIPTHRSMVEGSSAIRARRLRL